MRFINWLDTLRTRARKTRRKTSDQRRPAHSMYTQVDVAPSPETLEDRALLTVNLSVDLNSGTEAAETLVTATATADAPVVGNQTVTIGAAGTGITAGDFTLSDTTITILDGQTTGSVTFTIEDDNVVEAATETATLTISNPSAGITLGATTTQNVSITDNDQAVISIANDIEDEGIALGFVVSISNPVDIAVSATVNTQDGTATTSDGDYSSISGGTVNFAPLSTTNQTVTVNTSVDNKVENDESLSAILSALTAAGRNVIFNGGGGTLTGTGTITNEDTAVLSINDITRNENGTFTFTVTSSNPTALDITGTVNTADGSATDTGDYTAISGGTFTITGDGSDTTDSITVTVNNDRRVEGTENFDVNLTNPLFNGGADGTRATFTGGDASGRATITDNDNAQIAFDNATATTAENDEDRMIPVTITVTGNGTGDFAVDGTVNVDINNTSTQATEGADFSFTNIADQTFGSISTTTGTQTIQLSLSVIEDLLIEGNEDAVLSLQGLNDSTGRVSIGQATHTLTITDDDSAAQATFDLQGATGPNFTLSLDGGGANVEIRDGGGVLIGSQAAGASNIIAINGTTGADTLVIDLTNGNPIPAGGIDYDGGTGADTLSLQNGSVTTVTQTFDNNTDGTTDIDGRGVRYLNLAPIIDNLDAVNRVFTFAGGGETITLTNGGTLANQIDSDFGESVDFNNPTGSLTINAGSGNDTINITSIDAGFSAAFTVNGDGGNDTVNQDAAITTNATTEAITLNAETINLSANLQTDGADISITGDLVVSAASVLLDTETGNDTNSGSVTFTSSSISSDAASQNLTIDTSTSGANVASSVSLPIVDNTGTQNVTDLTVNTTVGAGTPGDVTFTDDVTIDGVANIDAQTITLNANIAFDVNGASDIEFDASRNVVINTGVDVTSVTGNITINANPASATNGNFVGIDINNASVNTTSGTITLNGDGGNSGGNHGVVVQNGGDVTASGAGAIDIDGIGRATGADGVLITGNTSSVSSAGGAITIDGTGTGGNDGVEVNGAVVTGTAASTITITGTGGAETTSEGVYLAGATTTISAAADIVINGTSAGDDGVNIENADITATGTASIDIDGISGTATASSDGVFIDGGGATDISSASGTINIDGTGNAAGGNEGVVLASGDVQSTSGAITIVGTGGNTANSDGIRLTGTPTEISTSGAIDLTGSGTNGDGVEIESGIAAPVTATGTGTIDITGSGAGAGNVGVEIDSQINSASGAVTIDSPNDIDFGAAGDIASTAGAVHVNGTVASNVIMANGAVISAGTGTIEVDAVNDISIGQLTTNNNTATAIDITSTSGELIDNGDAGGNDIIATGANAVVTITTATGIGDNGTGGGADAAIETDVVTLDASVTGTGSIDIDENDGITLTDVDTNNGSIQVDAGAAINADDVESSTDADANDIRLQATTGNIRIDRVNVGGGATAANGDVLVTATAGAITEANTENAIEVVADGLSLIAGGGAVGDDLGTANGLLDTTVVTLEGSSTGNFFLTNSQTFSVNDLDLDGAGADTDGAIGVTSGGTVRLHTTAGNVTFEDPLVANGQLVSVNVVGSIASNVTEAVPANPDIDINAGAAGSIALRAGTGIGNMANPLEIDAGTLGFVSAANDVFVTDRANGIVIDDVDVAPGTPITTSTSAGAISITANNIAATIGNSVRFSHDTTATGGLVATGVDTAAQNGDDVIVDGGVTISGSGVTLTGGDAVTLAHNSVTTATAAVTVQVDRAPAGNADAGTGGTVNLFGTINGTSVVGNGGTDNDTFIVFPSDQLIALGADADQINAPITLDGAEGNDFYRIHNGGLNGGAADVTIADTGVAVNNSDNAIVYHTRANETIQVDNNNGAGAAMGGFVDNETTNERVNYTISLERIESNGGEFQAGGALDPLDGNDTFFVKPSQSTRISIHGNEDQFGPGNDDVPAVAPDVLDLDSFNNPFTIIGKTIFVANGAPAAFQGVSFRNIESLPLTPIGTNAPLRFDFDTEDHLGVPGDLSPTEDGYTRVLPDQYFDVDGNTVGWEVPDTADPPDFTFLDSNDNTAGLVTPEFDALLRDSHGSTDAKTFVTTIANGWYLVSVKAQDVSDLRVTDVDNNLVLTQDMTIAGNGEFNFPVLVQDGTANLRFENAGPSGTVWLINGLEFRPGNLLTIGSPEPGALAADGGTIDTFQGFGSTPNGVLAVDDIVTISASIDTDGDDIPDFDLEVVEADDIAPDLDGVQVRVADIGGGVLAYTYRVVRPTAAGTGFIEHSFFDGSKTGCTVIDYVAPSLRRFDFQTQAGTLQTPNGFTTAAENSTTGGYLEVLSSQSAQFSDRIGFGWTDTVGAGLLPGNTTVQQDLTANFHTFQGARRFSAQLANDTYTVSLVLGSAGSGIPTLSLMAEGVTVINNLRRVGAGYTVNTFEVTVTDGQLDLDFDSRAFTAIGGIDIRTSASLAGAVTITAPAVGGPQFVADSALADITIQGTAPANSTVTVSSSRGTVNTAQDTQPAFEGVQVLADGGGNWSATIARPVVPGVPTLTVTTVDGTGRLETTDAAILEFTSNAAAGLAFDFGQSSTGSGVVATQAGFIAETADPFDPDLGYGWQGGIPGTFESPALAGTDFSDLLRDSVNSSTNKTFRLEFDAAQTFIATHQFSGESFNVSVATGTGATLNESASNGMFGHATHTVSTADVGGGIHRLEFEYSATNSPVWNLNGLVLVDTPSNPTVVVPGGTPDADGTTTSAFTVNGMTPGQVYTFSITGGAVINLTDDDSRIDGIQHRAVDASETFNVTAPAFGQTVTFTAEDVAGTGQASANQTYDTLAERRIDFNRGVSSPTSLVASPTAAGFVGADKSTIIGPNDAFGFVNGFVTTTDRGTATGVATTDLYRDSIFVDATSAFRIAVETGTIYDLRIYSGDEFAPSQVAISVEGVLQATSAVTTAGNYTSTVIDNVSDTNADGFLELTFATPDPLPPTVSFGFVNGFDIAEDAAGLPAAAPLLASAAGAGGASIDLSTVRDVAATAIDRLAASGLSDADIAHLVDVEIQVTDLGGRELGLAGSSVILIDIDAAGHGWFNSNVEDSDSEMDLLTVLLHEFGHTLGHSDLDPTLHAGDLMAGTLNPGEVRDVDNAFMSDDLLFDLNL